MNLPLALEASNSTLIGVFLVIAIIIMLFWFFGRGRV